MPSPVSADTASAPGRQVRAGRQIDLVGDADRVGAGPGGCARRVLRSASIEHEQAQVRRLGAGERAAQSFLLDLIGAVAQAGGIGEHHRKAGEVDRDLDHIACRAGDGRGDRRLAPCQLIE